MKQEVLVWWTFVAVVAAAGGVKHTFTAILRMFWFLGAVHEFLGLPFVLPQDEFTSGEKSVPSIDTGSRRRRRGSLWGCNWDVSLGHIELERGLCQRPREKPHRSTLRSKISMRRGLAKQNCLLALHALMPQTQHITRFHDGPSFQVTNCSALEAEIAG